VTRRPIRGNVWPRSRCNGLTALRPVQEVAPDRRRLAPAGGL